MKETEIKPEAEVNAAQPLIAYKGMDMQMRCREFQYEIGRTYTHEGKIVRCTENGFHSCEYPLDIFMYYEPSISRYFVVEPAGKIARDNSDSKIASAEITIKAEIKIPELVQRAIEWITQRCKPADSNHATGNRSASSATGYQSASSAEGISAVAINIGRDGKAKANEGGAIVLCYHNDDGTLRHIRAAKIGESGIKPDTWYRLDAYGNFTEVL